MVLTITKIGTILGKKRKAQNTRSPNSEEARTWRERCSLEGRIVSQAVALITGPIVHWVHRFVTQFSLHKSRGR